MERKYWSDYDVYIEMAHFHTNRLEVSYSGFIRFKKVKEVISSIANTNPDSKHFLYEGEIVPKKISQTEALSILDNIYKGKWDKTTAKCIRVANQVGIDLRKE